MTNAALARSERCPHLPKRLRQISQHKLRRKAEHAIARSLEPALPPRIGSLPSGLSMIGSIHFNDELSSRSEKVHDEPARHHCLAPKRSALLSG